MTLVVLPPNLGLDNNLDICEADVCYVIVSWWERAQAFAVISSLCRVSAPPDTLPILQW